MLRLSKRGLFGAYPQIGVPVGMYLATGLLFFLNTSMSKEYFASWGWRVPFLLSIVLIVVGYLIRRAVVRKPGLQRDAGPQGRKQGARSATAPQAQEGRGLLDDDLHGQQRRRLPADRLLHLLRHQDAEDADPQILLATTLASFGWLIFTLVGGWLSDKIGRVKTFLLGYAIVFAWMIPMFALIDTKDIVLYGVALFVLTIGLGLSYGPMSAMYAEMFPANVRYSGISIGYAFGAILGGAFAAMIAEALLQGTHWTGSIGIYIMILWSFPPSASCWPAKPRPPARRRTRRAGRSGQALATRETRGARTARSVPLCAQ